MTSPEHPFRDRGPIGDDAAVEILAGGDVELIGRMPWSSNATFLVDVCHDDQIIQAVYKPLRGERPLWDFPPGLHLREVAAYELSRALGWGVVPPTIVGDGPLGTGSLQLFVPARFEEHYFTLVEMPRYHADLQRICLLDVVANSTDRKSGHCLLGNDGRIHAVDNGLSFHEEFKLRTVIWDWAGEPIPPGLLDDLLRFASDQLDPFATLLTVAEVEAMVDRLHMVVRSGRFPVDDTGRRYPWPLV